MGLVRGTQTYQLFRALADHHTEDDMKVFILKPSRERTGTGRPLPLRPGNISVCFHGFENKQRESIPSQLPVPPHSGLQESVGTISLQGLPAKRERICQTCHTVTFTCWKPVLSSMQLSYTIYTPGSLPKVCQRWAGQGLTAYSSVQLPFSHLLLKLK